MAKSFGTLKRVAMMALAIIISLSVSLNAEAWPGQRLWEGAKKAYRQGEKVYETGKAAGDALLYLKSFGLRMEDFLGGRSISQFVAFWAVFFSLTVLFWTRKKKKGVTTGFGFSLLGAYLIGVAAGWLFELLSTWPGHPMIGDKELGLAVALLVLASMGRYLVSLVKALRAGQFKAWRMHWEYPIPVDPLVPVPAGGGEPAPKAEEPTPTEAPPSGPPVCHTCGTVAVPGDKFCGICATKLGPPECPACGTVAGSGDKCCRICGTRLSPRHCPACGTVAVPGDKFCGVCATKFAN